MTDIDSIAGELRQRTQWQDTPVEMTDEDYREIVRQAVRHLYVMTGRYTQYSDDAEVELSADEMEYVLTTDGLTKTYRNFRALDGLAMHVPKTRFMGSSERMELGRRR